MFTQLYNTAKNRVDLPFLFLLLCISPNKVYLKVLALLLIYSFKPDFKFLFNKNISRFYPLIILLNAIQFFIFGHDFSINHWLVFLVGTFYWLMCYAFMYQAYLFVQRNDFNKIHATIVVFAVINFAVCLLNYVQICIKAGTALPFLMEAGQFGASTGDHITGIFGTPSYINAIINSLLALYFIHYKKLWLFTLSAFFTIISFANIINLIFAFVLIVYLVIAGNTQKRLVILANIVLCVFMYSVISPQNFNYVRKTIGLSVSDEKEIMPEVILNKPGINSPKAALHVKYVNDSSALHQRIMMIDRNALFKKDYSAYATYYPVDIKSNPGKKIALLQTVNFLTHKPWAAVFGAGSGNFASRLAYQFSGRDSSRLFMKLPRYCHGYYYQNNLLIYDYMRQLPTEYHSIKHFPNNFISQLLGEYGLIGLVLFVLCYLLFFYRRVNSKSFFLIILISVGSYLMLDYLFEFFNVMLITEMILFIDIKYRLENNLEKAA